MDADALLDATYRGDLHAFEALVRSQAGRLHRIAWRVTGEASLADDVLQETFLRVLRVPAAARPSRAAAAWLARVTVRVALNVLEGERARRRREERYAAERSREMKDGATIGAALPHELDRPVADALASLSPETRAALWLHVVEGEGVREVAACLDSSRSAVSRRIRAGIEAMRGRLAKSGVPLAGLVVLRGALCGSEIQPPESLVRKILEAGRKAMAAEAASQPAPDALDAALAAPVRSSPSFAGIGVAAVIAIGLLAALGWFFLLRSGSDRGGEAARPIIAAPAALPANEASGPKREEKSPAPVPPLPAIEPAVVAGTVRDENKEPIASADVYLAMHPPAVDKNRFYDRLLRYFRADYYKRSRFLQTKTDEEGRYAFERVESGEATLSAFKEDYSGAGDRVKIDKGSRPEVPLVLADGMTLTGRVSAADGSPVADAIISVCQMWSPTDHIFRGAGLGPTDENGRFRVGLGAGTTACHLRVNSDSRGQDFFVEVPVADEDIELTFQEPAKVKGTITWTGGAPASGLTVRAIAWLPDPPIPITREGARESVMGDGPVASDGTYLIEGLPPKLCYDIFIIDSSLGERGAWLTPLSPIMRNNFRLAPGEVKVWDHAVPKPIMVRGHIRTEKGSLLPSGQVGARKDGKALNFDSAEANEEGFFELHLNTGPGEYVVHAEPPGESPADPVRDLIAERFGKTLHLAGGEEVEVDLTIFEPMVLPVRVLDHTGEPVKRIRAILHATFPDGRKMSHDAPRSLDDMGRTSFLLYYPAAEFWYEIGAETGGPTVETPRYAGVPGTMLEEKTIILPRTCDLRAALLDSSGKPYKEGWVHLHVTYEDGSTADFTSRTDKGGKFDEKGRVRATAFVLEIRSTASKVLWRSQRLDGSAGNALDLGEIVLVGGGD